jgi:hypothetical protein
LDQPFPGLLTVTEFPEIVGIPEIEERLRLTCWTPAPVMMVTPWKRVDRFVVTTIAPLGHRVSKVASALL